ncbi:collagenase [Spartinivicinus poritis]|uniref:Collagenase n=1 Tax=Spartinivicinus poritis TaxID=2994640 RepID=A0ABT5UEU4_9GAMM|nr:collagenase [Spartinivicinus sp. A2-2]MDE1464506.1 collagenase [Spartinivicinus sp. A2-2]
MRKPNGAITNLAAVSCVATLLASSPAFANQAPTTMSQSHQATLGKSVKSQVWGQDPEKQPLYYQLMSSPKYGTLSFDNYKGTFTYTAYSPKADYDEFRFKVWDGYQYSNESVVQFLFDGKQITQKPTTPTKTTKPTARNHAPTTMGQTNYIEKGKLFKHRAYGVDKDNDALTFTVVKEPKHGNLTLDSTTGQFTYFSTANVKQDIFSFRVFDGRDYSNVSSVYLSFNNYSTTTTTTKKIKPTKPVKPVTTTTTKKTKPTKPVKPVTPTTITTNLYPSHWTSKESLPSHVRSILSSTYSQQNSMTMGVYTKYEVLDIFSALALLVDQQNPSDQAFEGLIVYLKAWFASNSASEFSTADATLINNVLSQLINMPEIANIDPDIWADINYRSSIIVDGYATILDHVIRNKSIRTVFTNQLTNLEGFFSRLYQQQEAVNGARGYTKAIFTVFKTLKLYTYYANNDGELFKQAILSQPSLPSTMNKLGKSSLALFKDRYGKRKDDGFILLNTLWILGSLNFAGEEVWNQQVEQNIIDIVKAQSGYPDQRELKSSFYKYYVSQVYPNNAEETCNSKFSGLCYKLQVAEILPYTHQCSNSLKLRYQQLSQSEVKGVCARLSRQEYDFHAQMGTNWQPVKDDFNEDLELVVFNSREDYQRYGSALYKYLDTNNGGYYLEGIPSKQGNQARLFVYEENRFGKWDIRNLQHEYVHYLDGRFNKYGDFGNYNTSVKGNNIVWSTEGLAEFFAWNKNYRQDGVNSLLNSAKKGIPSLDKIIGVIYGESQTLIYDWSYTVNRFFYEKHRAEYLSLIQHLRNNQFDAYKAELDSMKRRYSNEYYNWVNNLINDLRSKQHSMGHSMTGDSLHSRNNHHANHMPTAVDQATALRPPLFE